AIGAKNGCGCPTRYLATAHDSPAAIAHCVMGMPARNKRRNRRLISWRMRCTRTLFPTTSRNQPGVAPETSCTATGCSGLLQAGGRQRGRIAVGEQLAAALVFVVLADRLRSLCQQGDRPEYALVRLMRPRHRAEALPPGLAQRV